MTTPSVSGAPQVSSTPSRQIERELTDDQQEDRSPQRHGRHGRHAITRGATSPPPSRKAPVDRQSTAPGAATPASAWKERRRLAAEKNGTTVSAADDASPVTMAKVGGAELLRSLRAEADRIAALGTELRERIDVLTDPTAAEAEVEAVRAAAEQRAVIAEAKAADAERRAAQADQFRAEADAAAEQMSEELTAAQNHANAAEQHAQAAETDRDAAVAKARADADKKVADAQVERAAAITQTQADASARIRVAEAERGAARKATADAEAATRKAQQETAIAKAAAVLCHRTFLLAN